MAHGVFSRLPPVRKAHRFELAQRTGRDRIEEIEKEEWKKEKLDQHGLI
jgi:hypothetical protein